MSPLTDASRAANKSDLSEQRAVTEEEGREAADAHNVSHYCETSAKTNEGIEGAIPAPRIGTTDRVSCFCWWSESDRLILSWSSSAVGRGEAQRSTMQPMGMAEHSRHSVVLRWRT